MRPRERRAAIIEAAERCFAGRGYHDTQISDIIAEAKVARGTFYLYFKSKHEIFHTILDDFIAKLQEQILTIELGADTNPAEQMRRNVERIVDLVFARPEIGKILFNEAVGLDKVIDERLREFYDRIIDMISSSIGRGISLGLVRRVNPRLAACIVLGAFREILIQSAILRAARIDRAEIIDGLIDVLLGGLSGKPVLG